MRLKQLPGVITLLLVLSTVGMAANSQLTNVNAAAQGNATVVTLHASGAFTHTEYRPTDTLLLVDLSGVSAGTLKEVTRTLAFPGVNSYHVLGYTGSNGTEVARIEMTLAPGATVDVNQAGDALSIKITDTKSAAKPAAPVAAPVVASTETAPAPKPAPAQSKAEPPPAVPMASKSEMPMHASGPVTVGRISVVRGEGTLNIEINGSAPMTAKTMMLSHPDRVVVDIADAVPAMAQTVSVNSGSIKEVRVGRFQSSPPVTRVVVDMASSHQFDLVPQGNKLVLKLRDAGIAANPAPVSQPMVSAAGLKPAVQPTVAASTPKPAVVPASQAAPVPASLAVQQPAPAVEQKAAAVPAKAQDFAMVEPQYHPASEASSTPKTPADSAAQTLPNLPKTNDNIMLPPVSASPKPAENTAQEQASADAQAAAAAQAQRPKYTGEPISVNLKDVDLKDFFRLIHEISGLNIVLDPNVKGTLTLVLDDVPWDQALDLVLANNGLDRKLQGNVLRIATVDTMRQEADAQRQKNEAEALSVPKVTVTHFLSYAQAKDVVPTVKRFLSQRGDVIADNRTNSVIVQDIPSVIPEVQRLLGQLDRKTQEVEIEARVVAATRNFARDIGVQVGFGWGNSATAVGGAPATGSSPNQVGYFGAPPYFTVPGINTSTTPPTSTTPASIPLFSNLPATSPTSGLNLANIGAAYRLDVILTAAESRGLVKILSRPRIITQNNVQATVKQGVSLPIVTAAQLGGPPTTTFVNAFLRLTVTPQITVENTIFLNLDVENTTPDFSQAVGGNPALLTQQATTSVLVTDGGTVVIGGVIQTQNSIHVDQVPLLGSIPYLGNLFKHRAVSTQTQELLFFVSPKIIQT
ncbi:MAG TPA: type IV pilus secretin PilQ [Terriglobales bacterium]|nr:type IV pilus secretin PilQ [Terriglobales bacterium]